MPKRLLMKSLYAVNHLSHIFLKPSANCSGTKTSTERFEKLQKPKTNAYYFAVQISKACNPFVSKM